MNNKSKTEQTWWFQTKNINGVEKKYIFTKLANGSIYFRPTVDDYGNPLSIGEFFGQAGQIDQMFRNSSNAKQDAKLELDNKELLALARNKEIPVTDNTNI